MILGFDLGTDSIGWCLLGDREILAAGSRIFSDGREPKSGNSLAEGRRMARGMARRRDRYKRRRKAVLRTLSEFGMMPADPKARAELVAETRDSKSGVVSHDVYALRARALDEKLMLHHIGRALFQLQQRRGFKSNRKADRKADSNEKGKIALGSERLHLAMKAVKARTLGEFLAGRRGDDPQNRGTVRVRIDAEASLDAKAPYDFYPDRAVLEDEFEKIWEAQSAFWPDVLTDERKAHLHRVMFYQRPLKVPVVGKCSFNSSEPRLAKAHPLFQAFRLIKEVNELELVMPDQSHRKLTLDQRNALLAQLRTSKTASFKSLRKTLKLSELGATFNKEGENRDKLLGDEIYVAMSDKTIFGNRWSSLSMDRQWEIMEKLRDEVDPLLLHAWLVNDAGLSEEAAQKAADAKLPEGYGRLGKTALGDMFVFMQAEVIPESSAAELAGYDHALARIGEGVESLPKYQEVLERRIPPGTNEGDDYDVRKGRITNPTVHIALNQLRSLTNRLIERYGRPERIHIELARELNQSADQKKEATRLNARNRRDAEQRSRILAEHGQPDNGFNRQLLKQWEELNPDNPLDRRCVYSGTVITPRMLFSGAVDIDHILPWSRTLDDSQANRLLCTREANRQKRNFTPAEVPSWADDYDAILERVQRLPPNKRWRFAHDAMARFEKDRDFLDRQLTDTQYLARLAHDYLGALYPDEEADGDGVVKRRNHVVVVTGRMTEMLRRKWGLNNILPDHNFGDATKGKNRKDHRHHAIDAAVIGATSRSLLQRIATASGADEAEGAENALRTIEPPWPSFREDLKAVIDDVVVSHKPDHGTLPKPGEPGKTAGQLHNDTAYGLSVDEDGNPIVVRRKPFLTLEAKDLPNIRDKQLQALLADETNGLTGRDFQAALMRFRRKPGHDYGGIRRVRMTETLTVIPIRDRQGVAYKGYKGDANFRYDVWEMPDGKWTHDVVTMFDAHRPNIDWQKRRPHPAAKKVLSLKQNDMVAYDDPKGGTTIGIVVKFGQNGQMTLVPHNEAGDLKRRDALPNNAEEALARGPGSGSDGPNEFDPFKYYSPTAGGLKKIGLRQVRVDETGRVFDPGPQAGKKRRPR